MFCVVSPAKKLNFEETSLSLDKTQPVFFDDTIELSETCKELSRADLSNLMHISEQLADLNYNRFQAFKTTQSDDVAKQAALAFSGDTYVGLDAESLNEKDFEFAQGHFGILSGFYGLLRPLDMIQPYRLEMGTRLKNPRGHSLYDFWGTQISQRLNEILESHTERTLVNCASQEYFKAINQKALNATVITPVFKEIKNGVAKTIGLMAKRARGSMARYIIQNQLNVAEDIKSFSEGGYAYQPDLSKGNDWVFTRELN